MSEQPNIPMDDEVEAVVPEAPPSAPEAAVDQRLERLGGEPAPDITPEEFARLRQSGQIHIDPRGRVRSRQRNSRDAGVSLRRRRAWYTATRWIYPIQMAKHQMILLLIAGVGSYLLNERVDIGSVGIMWATLGIIVIGFALVSIFGTWGVTRNFIYQYGMTMEKSIIENWQDNQHEMKSAMQFFFQSFGIGLIAMIGGLIVMTLAG